MKKLVLIGLLLTAAAGGLLYYFFIRGSGEESGLLKTSGNIEVTDVEVGFKIAGQVEQRLCSEGELVEQGQLVARLDTSDLVHDVALRQAELAAARATLAKLEAGYRSEEVAEAAAVHQSARAERKQVRAELVRQESLYEQDVISAREYEAALADSEVAEERVRQTRENLAKLRKGYRQEEIDEARAKVREAEEALALAETRLGYATLASPLSGVVLSENIEPGEHVVAGTPIVTIGDLDRVWLRAYIDETDLGRVTIGQRAWVTSDTWPDKRYEGRVSFISAESEFTPKNVQTEKERVRLVYRIKIDVDNPRWELKPGMPADARIELAERRGVADARH